MDNIINKIEENFQERIIKVQKDLDLLRTNEESKLIMNKLENMNENFFYNTFHPTLKNLNTLEGLEHTCNVLIQSLFDDMGIFLNHIVTNLEKESKDKLNKVLKSKGLATQDYNSKEVVNFDENGEWCNQDILLKFISNKELEDINQINLKIELRQKMGNKEIDFSDFGDLKKRFKNFETQNLKQLNPQIIEHFEFKID